MLHARDTFDLVFQESKGSTQPSRGMEGDFPGRQSFSTLFVVVDGVNVGAQHQRLLWGWLLLGSLVRVEGPVLYL
jgi:hypothetical protein